jgi:hypothetical protein
MHDPQVTYEEPRSYTPTNVIYWEATSKELRMAGKYGIAMLNKARKFLQNNSIRQIDHVSWICKPIKDYNQTEHIIIDTEKGMTCDCQGFKKKKKDYDDGSSSIIPICSHILAVKQFCFIEEKTNETL